MALLFTEISNHFRDSNEQTVYIFQFLFVRCELSFNLFFHFFPSSNHEKQTESSASEILIKLGEELISTSCTKIIERAFRCLGADLQEFLGSLDGVYDVLKLQEVSRPIIILFKRKNKNIKIKAHKIKY